MNTDANLQNFQHAHLEFDLNKVLFAPDHDGVIQYEEWRDIPDYEGYYQVSSFGRVKSLDRVINAKNGITFNIKGEAKKLYLRPDGYTSCSISKEGKNKRYNTHKLVAMAFLGHIPNKSNLIVNHKNFIKYDNRVGNLELITQRENTNLKHLKSSSIYTGVSWHKNHKKWESIICINGKNKYLGSFDSEKEANKYYENALIAHNKGEEILVKRAEFSSKHKGVFFKKREKKWECCIRTKEKYIHIGIFNTEEEAYLARKEKLESLSREISE